MKSEPQWTPTEFLRNWCRSAAPSWLPSSTPTDMPIANSAEPFVTGPQPVAIWQMHTASGPVQVTGSSSAATAHFAMSSGVAPSGTKPNVLPVSSTAKLHEMFSR